MRKFATCKRKSTDDYVQSGLATTPRQMEQMMQKGLPISSQQIAADMMFEGVENPSFDLPLDARRGIDVADCWQASEDVRRRAKNGLKADIKKYGQTPKTD